jgi:hypothetical protein
MVKLKSLERDLSYEQIVNARVFARKEIRRVQAVEREKYQNSGYISAAYNNYYTNAVYSYFSGFWVSDQGGAAVEENKEEEEKGESGKDVEEEQKEENIEEKEKEEESESEKGGKFFKI